MAKKAAPKVEKDNAERWLLTYADLITLLLIFFIVLYAISSTSSAKFQKIAQSLSVVFSGGAGSQGVLEGGSEIIPDLTPKAEGKGEGKNDPAMQAVKEKIDAMIERNQLEGKVSTVLEERGLVIHIKDQVLFGVGSDEINAAALPILAEVAKILADLPNAIRVEGHTDNIPIHNERFPSNWELSTSRATRCLMYLVTNARIEPERLSAAGYGEYKAVASNLLASGRSKNRRVDVVVLGSAFSKFEPGGGEL